MSEQFVAFGDRGGRIVSEEMLANGLHYRVKVPGEPVLLVPIRDCRAYYSTEEMMLLGLPLQQENDRWWSMPP